MLRTRRASGSPKNNARAKRAKSISGSDSVETA
jgi:hypothetical protein